MFITTSTGYRSTGNYSTGNYSTGSHSTGYRSTGHSSTGYRSTGNYSTGDCSTGYCSTGHRSTGRRSTGDWSISNYSSGHFSTIDYSGFGAFNKPCTPEEWGHTKIPNWFYFDLTEWIEEDEMTEKEKQENPSYKTTGGYLKVYGYKEAWRRSYDSVSRKEQLEALDVLNFDSNVFFEITGIRVEEEEKTINIDGRDYTLSDIKKCLKLLNDKNN